MASPNPDPQHPVHHSHKANNALMLAIGVIGGLALFIGIMYWYIHDVVNGPAPAPPNVTAADREAKKSAVITLDTPILEIEPLAEMHVKIVNGVAESIEPPDADVSAKLNGQDVTVTAAKDAKEGPHLIKIHGAKGQETILKVTVKKK